MAAGGRFLSEETKHVEEAPASGPEPASAEAPVPAPEVAADANASADAPASANNGKQVSVPASPEPSVSAGDESVEAKAEQSDEPKGEDGSEEAPKPRKAQARNTALYRAYRANRSVEGKVVEVIKGGYEVRVGKARGFCPRSQMDLLPVSKPEQFVGQTLLFRITQVRRGGEDVVLSRRALLEDERSDEAKAVRATLIEGSVMQGHVAGLADFGAFVDLGAGVMGLVHVSELSHSRVDHVEDVVKPGDTVSVRILKLDEKQKRISLSIRQAQEDPWSTADQRFRPGEVYTGTVERVADFGAFVQLAPGVEALAPASELPPAQHSWREELVPGHSRDWLVLSVDAKKRRISLTPHVEGFAPAAATPLAEGATLQGKVQRVERFGVFVWLGPGRVGLMPTAWAGVPRGLDLERRFPVGSDVEVDVKEIAEDGRRIRLARTGAKIEESPRGEGRPERRPRREPRRETRAEPERPPESDSGPFGTILADKLRAALGQDEKS